MLFALLKFIPAPYQWLAKFALFGAIAGVILYAAMQAYSWAYDNGARDEKALWRTLRIAELEAHDAELAKINAKMAADAKVHGLALNAVSAKYQREQKNEKDKHDSTIASLRAGTIRLRDKYAKADATACAGVPPGAYAAAGRLDDAAGAELSRPLGEFLIGIMNEADGVVNQLTACQAGWQKTYETCTQ